MSRALTLVIAPTVEPVSLGEVKAWAKIDLDDDDALIVSLIAAAREAAEEHLRRSLVTQTWKLTLDLACSRLADLPEGVYDLPSSLLFGDLPQAIRLPKGPVQSVASVVTFDTANQPSTYSGSNYYVDAANGRLVLNRDASWPGVLRPRAACEITYVTGYGGPSSVPQSIRTAILMHVQRMYDGRIVCEMPEGCLRLLKPYRILGDLRG